MRTLLDTHAFPWWMVDDDRRSSTARRTIAEEENDLLIGAASAWEITAKFRLHRRPEPERTALDVVGAIVSQGFRALTITVEDAERAGGLPGPHRDPFDRMLAAQSLSHDLPILSKDRSLDDYGVRRIW